MMTSSNGNIFRVTGHLCGEFTGHRWHDDVIKWKHFPRYWPFVRGIHRSPVNPPHKGQWRGALLFTLICARINGWVNNCKAGDLKRNRAHYDVIVMEFPTQRSVTRNFDVFFDLRLNKPLSKQWWGCWFETPSSPLWRHRNVAGTGDFLASHNAHDRTSYTWSAA